MKIFKNSKDCERFLRKMWLFSKKYKVKISCYALMENHFHFLVRIDDNGSLGNFMQKLQQSYAIYFNFKYNRRGGVFDSRFKAKEIDEFDYLMDVQRYIAKNPIKALKLTSFLNSSVVYPEPK